MATYVEPHWKWYIAEVVSETQVDGDSRLVGHIVTYLLFADNPDEAYSKALALLDEGEDVHCNSDGNAVRSRDLGIHEVDNLQVTELKDGDILASRTISPTSHGELMRLVRPKQQHSLFGEPPYEGPNIDDA